MELDVNRLIAAPFLISLFFWGRGLLKGNRDDILLGLVLLVLSSFLAIVVVGHSGVISFIGGFLFLFGIVSLLMRKGAVENRLMSTSGALQIGIVFVILGILASLII
jgi:thiol:disulfide interchange protein